MMHIYFVSLGCDKNLVDSEKMLALLTKEGYELTDEPEQAEIIVVNTCAFIHDAKQESIETLLELAEYKKTGKCKRTKKPLHPDAGRSGKAQPFSAGAEKRASIRLNSRQKPRAHSTPNTF